MVQHRPFEPKDIAMQARLDAARVQAALDAILQDQSELPRKRRFDVHFSYRATLKDWRSLAHLARVEEGGDGFILISDVELSLIVDAL
jgi:hypothetical protein